MITQSPVIITEPFTPELTNIASAKFANVQRIINANFIDGPENKKGIFVQRIRRYPKSEILSSVFFTGRVFL